VKEKTNSITHSSWEIRNSRNKNVSTWDLKPVKGNYVFLSDYFQMLGISRIKYQVEEAY